MEGVNFGWLMNAMAEPDVTDPVSDKGRAFYAQGPKLRSPPQERGPD
jgi:hypothetical protein